MEDSISLMVNGRAMTLGVSYTARLCDVLRETLSLTGTHVGCSEGVCGNCTVLIYGKSARSCLSLAGQCDGARVDTVEAFTVNGELGPAQEAMVRHNAIQCGFCTPAFVVMLEELRHIPGAERWDDDTLRHHLSAVVCRCTGYQPILAAARFLLSGR
jgi:2-furoyl-CoA dehydrogenase 2Fe-2S iron sulfur subunit